MRVLIPDALMDYERVLLRAQLESRGHAAIFAEADAEAEAVLTGGPALAPERLAALPRLRAVVRFARGRHDLAAEREAAARADIAYRQVSGASAASTAEHALMLMLALLRRLPQSDRRIRDGAWCRREIAELGVRDLAEVTVGLIGLGRVGRRLARLLRPFGPRVLYTKRARLPAAEEEELGIHWASLEALLDEADVVSLQARTTGDTAAILTRDRLKRLRPGAVVVNVGDGRHLDAEALEAALAEGSLSAGLDVYPREPYALPASWQRFETLLATPHVAGRSRATADRLFRRAVEALEAGTRRPEPPAASASAGPVLGATPELFAGRRPLAGWTVRLPPAPPVPGLEQAVAALGADRVETDGESGALVELRRAAAIRRLRLELEAAAPAAVEAFSIAAIPALQHVLERWRLDFRVWDRLLPRLARGSLPGRRLVLEGYGPRGRLIAWRARELGLEVVVAERSPELRLEALYDGFELHEGEGNRGDLRLSTGEAGSPPDAAFEPVAGIPEGLADEVAAAAVIALGVLGERREAAVEEITVCCDELLTQALLAGRTGGAPAPVP